MITITLSFDTQTHCLAHAHIEICNAYRFLKTRLEHQISTVQVHAIKTLFLYNESPGVVETVA